MDAPEEDNLTEKQLESLKDKVASLSSELDDSKEERERSQKLMNELKAKLAAQGEAGNETAELDAVRQEVDRLKNELYESKLDLGKSKEKDELIELLQNKVQRLEETDALRKKQLHESQVENQEQNALLATTMEKVDGLKEDLASTVEELARLQRTHEMDQASSHDTSTPSDRKRERSDDEVEDEDDDEVEVIEAEIVAEPSAKKLKNETDDEDDDDAVEF